MARFDEIAKIYDHKLTQLRDPKMWERTLRLTSNFWRLTFCAALLLTAQNPRAEMCGTIDQWNRVGRYIKRGEHSVAVFRSRTDTQLMYLFDVKQTYGAPYNAKWQMSDRIADGIVGKYNAEHSEPAVSFDDFLQKELDSRINAAHEYCSEKLNAAISDDPRVLMFIRYSAECICAARCGIDGQYDFADAGKFDSDLSTVDIGNAATLLAQDILRDIDGIVRRKDYERYEAGVCGRHLRYPLYGGQERAAEPDIRELRQGADDADGAQGGRPDERHRPDGAGYGEHERTVHEHMAGDRGEGGSREGENQPRPAHEISAVRELHEESVLNGGDRPDRAGSGVGISEDEHSLVGGGSAQPQDADGDTENTSEYDDELNDDETASDEDAVCVFNDAEELSPNSSYCQNLLRTELAHSGWSLKLRINDFISENNPSKRELAKFLKKEYGIGGGTGSCPPIKWHNHGSKGIELVLNDDKIVKYSWTMVAESVRDIVRDGEYITEQDKDNRARAAINEAERFAIHYEFPTCFDNRRLPYIRKELSECGIDYDINLDAKMFIPYAAEYARTKGDVAASFRNTDHSAVNVKATALDFREAADAARTLVRETNYEGFVEACRSEVSNLISELSAHVGHNPDLGFSDDEAAAFFAGNDIFSDENIAEISAQVFGYLYGIEQRDKPYEKISDDTTAEQQISLFDEAAENEPNYTAAQDVVDNDVRSQDESAPKVTITCDWSESSAFESGKEYTVAEFDRIMAQADKDKHDGRQAGLEKYGSDEAWEAQDKDGYYSYLGYDKTKFTVNLPNGDSITERQDIGDGYGGVIDYFRAFDSLQQYVPLLEEQRDLDNAAAVEQNNVESQPVTAESSDVPAWFRDDIANHSTVKFSEKEKTETYVVNANDFGFRNYRLIFDNDENAYRLIADSEKAGKDMFVRAFESGETADSIYRYFLERGLLPQNDSAEIPQKTDDKPLRAGNYHFADDFVYPTGPKAKYSANVAAIKTLKLIESEHRHATAEEQDVLAHYSGWGGVADAFDSSKEGWSREYAELKDLLTDKEYAAARESTLTAFYTEPYIIKSIYTALGSMGFTGGEILDPAMGTGNFFGNLPAEIAANSHLYGVELDDLTARIAKQLYPDADIQHRGYERTKFENGKFDVIVGNVPFGDFAPYDPEYRDYLIHDYFFAKSIDKLKAGGIMAFITSAGTMDKSDDELRRELYCKADFLGGIRLPEDAFRTAGTQVVTDILFFQKLDHERAFLLPAAEWIDTNRVFGKRCISIENKYFTAHPEMTLGHTEEVSGPYGYTRTVQSDGDTAERLETAVSLINGKFSAEPTIDAELPEEEYGDIPDGVTPYTYYVSGGALYYAENRSAVPFDGKNAARITDLCGIMAHLDAVTSAQMRSCTDNELAALQKELDKAYDAFVKKYGYINSKTNTSAFADDIRAPRLGAIENVEELPDGTQHISKADIFTQRTINVERIPEHVDTALEALHLSMNAHQRVDIDFISQLCGKDKDEVIAELGDRIYCNPAKNTGSRYTGWETAEEYLSGHVRTKLANAQEAAKTEPAYERNVTALLQNQPPRIGIENIGFRLGTIYITPEMYQQFVYETFDTPVYLRHTDRAYEHPREITVNYSNELNKWKISNSSGQRGVLVDETYGTGRFNAYELTEMLLNQTRATVNDYIEQADGSVKKVFNADETILARECQDKIEQAFHDWVMADSSRIQIIEDSFNSRYNSIKPRTYDGSYISVPGMNPNLTLRPHQKDVIARIAATGTCMMAHEVGAGKTAAMGAAGMYLKSIGACTKPMYVVPNAVVAQFGEELQRFFPEAKILVATSKDMEKSQRRRFLSKISIGNFDAIVIPQSQFEKMPLSLERQEAMYDEKLTEISYAIQAARADKGERFTVKALERQRKQIESKIEKMRADFKKDDFITFEELGCDFLFVDEAHGYKNLAVFSKMTNVAGVNVNANSQKAFDMEMKCRYLQELHHGGGVVFATGTPVSNSITELFVWQYLLQKQTLDDMNIGYFDNWASVFGVISQSDDVKPTSDGYRSRTRFSNFANLDELCNLFGEVFDIAKTADMNLKLPSIYGGKPEMIICEKSPEQDLQTDEGIERARRIEAKLVTPDEDNMLAVCTYMTKVALDARIIDPEAEEYDGGKIALCADKIIEINRAKPGTAQAVFCDTSTPKKGEFSVYQALKDRLMRSGEFTEKEIAFVHDAANDKQRLEMFEKVNRAEIKVIIGSTSKLGTGVNIQQKLSALHHLDAPYRPSDIEQRNGRGIRQGNENSEVFIGYYSTKGTFDNYRWQILEKKQQIISQIMSGKPAARTCEDIDETALTFAEMKAATTGNPLIAEKMTVDNNVNRLKLLQSAHVNQQRSFEHDISVRYPDLIARKGKMIGLVSADIERIKNARPIKDDDFSISLGGRTYTERALAGKALEEQAALYLKSHECSEYKPMEIGRLNDFKIFIAKKDFSFVLVLRGSATYTSDYQMSGLGGITRLCNLYGKIPEQLQALQNELGEAQKQLENAKAQYGKPFPYESDLKSLLERQSRINAELEFLDRPHDEVFDDESSDDDDEMEM